MTFFKSSTTNFELPYFRYFNTFSPYLKNTIKNVPLFSTNLRVFTYFVCFSFPPTFTMMHLCITQCAYWTPLPLLFTKTQLGWKMTTVLYYIALHCRSCCVASIRVWCNGALG